MAYPPTFTAGPTTSIGQKLPAATLNSDSTSLTELQTWILLFCAGAISTSTGTLTSGTTPTEIACGSTEKLSGITASSGRLVVPNAGWYNVSVQVGFPSSGTGQRALYLGINAAASGKITDIMDAAATGQSYINAASQVFLNASDTLSVFAYQSSLSTMTSNIVARVSAAYALSA